MIYITHNTRIETFSKRSLIIYCGHTHMAFKKFEEYEKIFREKELQRSDAALIVARDLFGGRFRNDKKWDEFIKMLGEKETKKMSDLVWFYYHLSKPYTDPGPIRDELRLITITSVIEALMSDHDYKDFLDWYRDKYKKNSIEDLKKAETEYLAEFGATSKVRLFFDTYFTQEEKNDLLEDIKPYPKPMDRNIKDVAKFFYDMRSEFVHSAQMSGFCPPEYILAGVVVKRKPYTVTLEVEGFMDTFEAAFARYWLKKAGYESDDFYNLIKRF